MRGTDRHGARVLLHVVDITALAAQAFCWLCGHATGYQHTWSEIDNHSCGRYKEEADKRIDQAQRNSQRYQHYCLRWCVILLFTGFSSCALLACDQVQRSIQRYQHYCLRVHAQHHC